MSGPLLARSYASGSRSRLYEGCVSEDDGDDGEDGGDDDGEDDGVIIIRRKVKMILLMWLEVM